MRFHVNLSSWAVDATTYSCTGNYDSFASSASSYTITTESTLDSEDSDSVINGSYKQGNLALSITDSSYTGSAVMHTSSITDRDFATLTAPGTMSDASCR